MLPAHVGVTGKDLRHRGGGEGKKGTLWHRETIVGIRTEVLWATRIRCAPAGGSSSVFSRALAACGVIRSAGQRIATRGRSENALRESSSRSARISSIRRNCVSGAMKRKFGWAPDASSRQS